MVRLGAGLAALAACLLAFAPAGSGAGTPACRTADVHIALLMAQGAAGSGRADFLVRNTSSRACHTFGYPGLALYDRHGHRSSLHIARSTSALGGTIPERRVTLAPRAAARFFLSYVEISNSGSCPLLATARVRVPGDRQATRVGLHGGIAPCSDARVSPIEVGHQPR